MRQWTSVSRMIHPINRYIIQDLLVPSECMAHQTNGIKVCSSISWNTTFHTFISWSPLITIPKNRWREELEKTYTIYVFESHDFFQGLLLRIEPTSLDGTAKHIYIYIFFEGLTVIYYNSSFTGCVPINKYDSMKSLCIQPHRKKHREHGVP